jgi:hypothetical protein
MRARAVEAGASIAFRRHSATARADLVAHEQPPAVAREWWTTQHSWRMMGRLFVGA